MPPNFAFQLYSVASETPCFRAKSAVFAPASCSRSTPIICSSVNLARFICPSFRRPDSNFNWRKSAGAGQKDILDLTSYTHKLSVVNGHLIGNGVDIEIDKFEEVRLPGFGDDDVIRVDDVDWLYTGDGDDTAGISGRGVF